MQRPEIFNVTFFAGCAIAAVAALATGLFAFWPAALVLSATSLLLFFIGSDEITVFSVVSAMPLTGAWLALLLTGPVAVVMALSATAICLLVLSALETNWIPN